MLNNVSWLRVSARPLITDVTSHRAPSLDGFHHFRFYCSNFAVKYLLIIADILVITYTGELMFNIMICNITKIRIRLSICTSSEVVLSSICSLTIRPIYMWTVCRKRHCLRGNTICMVHNLLEYLTPVELEPGPLTDVVIPPVVLSLACNCVVVPVMFAVVSICLQDSTWNKHMR